MARVEVDEETLTAGLTAMLEEKASELSAAFAEKRAGLERIQFIRMAAAARFSETGGAGGFSPRWDADKGKSGEHVYENTIWQEARALWEAKPDDC